MRIGIAFYATYLQAKGPGASDRRIKNYALGLGQVGNDVEVIVPLSRNTHTDFKEEKGYTVTTLGNNGSKLNNRLNYWKELVNYVKKEKVTALLLYNTAIDSVIPAYVMKKNGAVVIGEFCDLHSGFDDYSKGKRLVRKAGEILLPKATTFNIVISSFLEKIINKYSPSKPILTIPILIESHKFQTNHESGLQFRKDNNLNDFIVISYLGSLWEAAGMAELFLASQKLIKEGHKIKLVISGKLLKQKGFEDVEQLSKNLNIEDNVLLTGWVNTETVIQIQSATDIFVVPQRDYAFLQAGLPSKFAEYASMGKAIIATEIGDIGLYFRHLKEAMLCKPEDVEDLKRNIEKLILDKDLRNLLGTNARKMALEKFDNKMAGVLITNKIKESILTKK